MSAQFDCLIFPSPLRARARAYCCPTTGGRFSSSPIDDDVAAPARLPRWAHMTARNAELLAYLQRDEAMRRFGAAYASQSSFTKIANKKEKMK